LAPGLTYLSCGNFAEFNPPRVAWEYEYEGGAQKDSDDDLPPTYFKDHLSESTPTFEEDIGILGSTGSGVNYEVAFTNVSTDCNTPDNIQLDVVEITTNFTCKSPTAYQDELSEATWTQTQDPTTSQDDFTGHKCLEFKGAEIIRNSNNDKSVFYNMVLTPPNRLGTGKGPGIPIDLVMQCSDNRNEEYDECDDQSMCMHIVSFKDVVDSASPIERAEAMAKRGYICEAISNYPGGIFFGSAKMHCELADGRTMVLALRGWTHFGFFADDSRARLTISILD
jgi:hypothetical protein